MNSLRERLLAWLLGAVLLVGASVGWLVYRVALAQANASFDEQLRQTALLLRDQPFQYPVRPDARARYPEHDFVVQVWSLTGVRIYFSRPYSVLPGLTAAGLSTVETSGGTWRVFSVNASTRVIQVAQPMQVRERHAGRFALAMLQPFVWLMPLLAVVVWLVVGRALAPLQRLAASLRARPVDALDALPHERLPEEVQPLVQGLNDLLRRLSAALGRERAFLADAAHELRTPLTALQLQMEALERAHGEAARRAAKSRLSAGVQRATRVVEQLLSIARHEQRPLADEEDVALDDLAREVLAELIPMADARNVDLGLADSQHATVRGDREALRTLVRNLVDNAVRYSFDGGNVDVSVRRRDAEGAGLVVLTVLDSGPGIPDEERSRVFDRFHRVAGTSPAGSGLGLAIVRSIANAHDAHVDLSDNPAGRGLRVRVSFPSARAS